MAEVCSLASLGSFTSTQELQHGENTKQHLHSNLLCSFKRKSGFSKWAFPKENWFSARTTLPVVGIPVKSSTLDGLDALLSTVQMPSGMPVATVAIDGAENAALLAVQILAVSDDALRDKLESARRENTAKILAKDAEISAKYQ